MAELRATNLVVVAAALALGGCATVFPVGALYTELELPVAATSNSQGNKIGRASCRSVLALVATGDCSLETAKRNGGIQQVTHVDWKARSILGIIGDYELVVYGK
jgi:hypothetical protein